ncbi:Ectonucleotide pyrophosphatase/phosphodiesterase family member 3 [Bagarius yarrelli]|uniref:Ectonucleotide pyrophosphatase/phosphodiesterase family member 3 n=1 Tax=Bagarius yarrelli TaxID=175774 RepID=A0A556UZB4_BAGYA|nr:Ectonucleotide pyrophosphatase/phosphodiesterase family member 3 [Bagarius yarrelli]
MTAWVQDQCTNMSSPQCPPNFKRQPLLLISLDGLRAEYQHTWHSLIPVLDKLRKCGTSSAFMQPVFPSKTFPNHYSIVTGLYSESHGLVDNNMYDPVFDASFSLSNAEKDNPRWYLGQPLISAIQGVDTVIGQLMNGLKQLNLHECINIIVVADHVDAEGLVNNLTCKRPDQKIKPYLKQHLPKRFHYAHSRRIEDVNVLVESLWLFERYPGSLRFCSGGNHGYDNDDPNMQAMFLSYGPKFNLQTEVEPFSNIELYNLMCDILEITPAPNNGSHGSLNHLLRTPPYTPQSPVEQSVPGQCPLTHLEPTDQLGCSCPAMGDVNLNSQLNLSDTEVSQSESKHLLFGRPLVLQSESDYCLLLQRGFISAYSKHLLMPLWSSFTVEKQSGGGSGSLPALIPDCLRADVRLQADQSPTCNNYNNSTNITYAFLYPPTQQACILFSSTLAEIPAGFQVGPKQSEIPNRRCFDLSNQDESKWVEDLLWFHQSRVRDIEWITGLEFFEKSGQTLADVLRIKTQPTAAIYRK